MFLGLPRSYNTHSRLPWSARAPWRSYTPAGWSPRPPLPGSLTQSCSTTWWTGPACPASGQIGATIDWDQMGHLGYINLAWSYFNSRFQESFSLTWKHVTYWLAKTDLEKATCNFCIEFLKIYRSKYTTKQSGYFRFPQNLDIMRYFFLPIGNIAVKITKKGSYQLISTEFVI